MGPGHTRPALRFRPTLPLAHHIQSQPRRQEQTGIDTEFRLTDDHRRPAHHRARHLTNVYVAAGAGRSGLLLAPGIGAAIADLAAAGVTGWDIAEFAPGRFA